jgi:hypothetical protein
MSVFTKMIVAAGLAGALVSSGAALAGASTGTWKYSPGEIRHEQMRQRYEQQNYRRRDYEPRGYYQGRHEGWRRGRPEGWTGSERY